MKFLMVLPADSVSSITDHLLYSGDTIPAPWKANVCKDKGTNLLKWRFLMSQIKNGHINPLVLIKTVENYSIAGKNTTVNRV